MALLQNFARPQDVGPRPYPVDTTPGGHTKVCNRADKIAFLDQTLCWPCHGDPAWTYADVERAVQKRLRASCVIDVLRMREADATRKRELAQLAGLQAKYGAGASPAAAPAPSRQPTRQDDLFAL